MAAEFNVNYNHIVSKHYRSISHIDYSTLPPKAGATDPKTTARDRMSFLLGMPSWLTPEQRGRCVATERGWELIPVGQTMKSHTSAELIKCLPGLATLLDGDMAAGAVDVLQNPTQPLSTTYSNSVASLQGFVAEALQGGITATQTTNLNITFTSIGVTRRSKRRYTINLTLEEPLVAKTLTTGASITITPTFTGTLSGTNESGSTGVNPINAPHAAIINIPDNGEIQFARVQFPVEFSDDMVSFGTFNLTSVAITPVNMSSLTDTQGRNILLAAPIYAPDVTTTNLGYGL